MQFWQLLCDMQRYREILKVHFGKKDVTNINSVKDCRVFECNKIYKPCLSMKWYRYFRFLLISSSICSNYLLKILITLNIILLLLLIMEHRYGTQNCTKDQTNRRWSNPLIIRWIFLYLLDIFGQHYEELGNNALLLLIRWISFSFFLSLSSLLGLF